MEASLPSRIRITEKFWDNIGIKYEEAFAHDTGLHNIVQKWLELFPANAQLLDCGCGTGKPVAHMIATSGRRVHGIDISQGMIDLSRRQVPSGTFQKVGMLEYVPMTEFDGVVANLSLFHFTRSELTSITHKWFQWLKLGGYLLIGVMTPEDMEDKRPESYHSDGQCTTTNDSFMGSTATVTLFTKEGWKKVLEAAGFEIFHTEMDVFTPRGNSAVEPHYFIIAKKGADA